MAAPRRRSARGVRKFGVGGPIPERQQGDPIPYLQIRNDYMLGEMSIRELCAAYKVCYPKVAQRASQEAWVQQRDAMNAHAAEVSLREAFKDKVAAFKSVRQIVYRLTLDNLVAARRDQKRRGRYLSAAERLAMAKLADESLNVCAKAIGVKPDEEGNVVPELKLRFFSQAAQKVVGKKPVEGQ